MNSNDETDELGGGNCFESRDLWPFSPVEVKNLLLSFLPPQGSGNALEVVLPGFQLTSGLKASTLGVNTGGAKVLTCNRDNLAVGPVPSGRQEVLAYSGSIPSSAGIQHIWLDFLECDSELSADSASFLPFRFPWDVFANVRWLLEHHWRPILTYLVDYWELTERSPGVWASASAYIDSSVVFRGEAVLGADVVARNGAIIGEQVVVCEGTLVEQYCRVAKYSILGHRSHVGHCAEVSGTLCSDSLVRHFGYFRGVLGPGANLSGGTSCGTDRFDGSMTTHVRDGQVVPIGIGANEVYLGRKARTGANTCLTAGSMLGVRSRVGPGLCFSGYVEDGRWIWPHEIQGAPRTR